MTRSEIVTIGTITSNQGDCGQFIDIEVYGSHRGFDRTSYFGYNHFIIMAGDKISSNQIASAGGSSGLVSLYTGTTRADYNNNDIGAGFDVKLSVNPNCGANFHYTYVVRYRSDLAFTPSTTRDW